MRKLSLSRELAQRTGSVSDVRRTSVALRERVSPVAVGLRRMNFLRALLSRFRPQRRPPTGPLTIEESNAEAIREQRIGEGRKPQVEGENGSAL